MEKQKLNVATIVLIVAIVLIMGVIAGVFIGKNMSQVQIGKKSEEEKIQQENKTIKNEITENGTIQTNIQDNKGYSSSKQEARKELDINSEQIKKLYGYIPVYNANKLENNAYQSSKTTKDKISVEYLLANAFIKIEKEIPESAKEEVKEENGSVVSGWYKFDAEILQKVAKEMYGENIENKPFDIGYGKGCEYNNGKYMYGAGGGSDEGQNNVRSIIRAYEKDEKIYIEDSFICLKRKGDDVKLYLSSDSKETAGVNFYTTTEMPKYRHTFKKNEEGIYYWYSTEPIK